MLLVDGQAVHETVANALPLLTHQQMLRATKSLDARRFEPGQTILHQGQPNDRFYMIAKGRTLVEILGADGTPVRVADLGPGQFFGEVSLTQHQRAAATIKAAADNAVELVALDRAVFHELMNEAHSMRDELLSVVDQRLSETSSLSQAWTGAGGRYAQTSLA
jgi:CRP-like cAMP-binding protein